MADLDPQEKVIIFNSIWTQIRSLVVEVTLAEIITSSLYIARRNCFSKEDLKNWASLLKFKPDQILTYILRWMHTQEMSWLDDLSSSKLTNLG